MRYYFIIKLRCNTKMCSPVGIKKGNCDVAGEQRESTGEAIMRYHLSLQR